MGAKIRGAGTDTIVIEGVERLNGASYDVLPDRIETGTYLVAGAITGGRVRVKGTRPTISTRWWRSCAKPAPRSKSATRGSRSTWAGAAAAPSIFARAVSGVPDRHAGAVRGAQYRRRRRRCSDGNDLREPLHAHAGDASLGADIRIEGSTAIIRGVPKLTAAPVMATDLRASASLVLAGLIAQGATEIHRIYHIDRGYECIEEKLEQLGARIKRMAAS
jgi:UDP-N-acetylglucosamine 1-carboxyvinyltransferase